MDKNITLRNILSMLDDQTCQQVTVNFEKFSIALSPSNLLYALNDELLDMGVKEIYPAYEHSMCIILKEN